ncbi:glycosyltransferase [Leptobacterium flavescens]|uniref:Glycosyltransferase n=1 Tax=Leptobacterium flavescens TaxID=472055 RepID=A0A6P0UI95_9FLAO|nr:glycosyltransferase [Leptobacterium flavescens]NER12180.1 glycosyltransferase [Leptobacterium flavescens]
MSKTIKRFTILITTRNRLSDLKYTLSRTEHLINREDVECIICNDASTDGTQQFLQEEYPQIKVINNKKSKGVLNARNLLMNSVRTEYAVTIDDDIHFLSEDPLEEIEHFFKENINCGLLGFRIYWSKEAPSTLQTNQVPKKMKSFGAGAHAFRMSAWKEIPDYPSWFVFYGEEDFASLQLFKKNWDIYYFPKVLVQHRVNLKERKQEKDYLKRLRRSFRAGWYLYFIFYPLKVIPRKLMYTLWMQLKLKVFKGDIKALRAILLALLDIIVNFPKLVRNRNRLTAEQYKKYTDLQDAVLYWSPEKEQT